MTTPLPPTDPSVPDEPLPGETGLAALYRQLPRSEPGPALDAAVLRAAAQALAVDGNPLAVERRRGPRERGDWVRPKDLPLRDLDAIGMEPRPRRLPPWLLTLGSAASLVLVAGLAWKLRESSPPAPTPVAQEVPAGIASAAPAKASPAAARPAPAIAPEPVASARPPAPARPTARQAAAATTQSDAPQATQPRAAAKSIAPPPAVAQFAAPAPPAPPAPARESSGQAAGGLAGRLDQRTGAPSAAMPAPAAAPVAANDAARDQDTAQQTGDTPARELDKIRQLFEQGQRDQALPRLRAFRQAHPQWPLPPALQAQLQEP